MSQSSIAFKELNIPALANSAEHGDGCPVRLALEDLGYEERFKALKLIQDQSTKDHDKDPSLPKLEMTSTLGGSRGSETKIVLRLSINRGNQIYNYFMKPNVIYYDELSHVTGIHTSSCWNKPDKP